MKEGAQLDSQTLRALHRKVPVKAILGILRAWLPILAVFYVQAQIQTTWLFLVFIPVGAFIIASRQHAFAGLTHEAVHGNMFKNRSWNDFVGRYLFSYPLLVSYNRYKKLHMEHHRHLFTDKDPDTPIFLRYPLLKEKFYKLLRKDLRGGTVLQNLSYFAELPEYLRDSDDRIELSYKSDRLQFYAFHLLVIVAMILSGNFLAYLLFWVLPYVTILQVFLRIRGALEHGAVKSKDDPLLNTRTVTDNPLVLSFMAPLGLNYHLEHHLYPSVPWYHLHELHEKVRASNEPGQINVETLTWPELKNLVVN